MAEGNAENFYAQLTGFADFDGVIDFEDYVRVPDDWTVLVSDVVGSTKAIAAGRYKDVNMLGAASITAVLNACDHAELPFAFGGDGGVVIVPPALAANAGLALGRLADSAPGTFNLSLRAAGIPVGELRRRGADLLVRKYTLSPGNHLAMFSGNGLDLADAILKGRAEGDFVLTAQDDELPDLTGLSCRWEPLQPQSGLMMSVIVKPEGASDVERGKILDEVLAATNRILGAQLTANAPASEGSVKFRWPPRGLMTEARATAGKSGVTMRYAYLLAETFVQGLARIFGWRVGAFDAPAYERELRTNTDFRKFDGHLRMVLDVSHEQADALQDYLDGRYRDGKLVYGLHRADAALMTCLVFSLEQSEHVHFIDGANGGYAMAATDFKQRLAKSATS